MSRIASCFSKLKQANRSALIIYIAAGDPHPDFSATQMHALVAAGADIIELGVPFSDPMADGPIIQQAYERALKHNVSLLDVLNTVAEFRRTNRHTPVVLMGYMNPIEALGAEVFASRAAEAGVDGALTVDLPPDASEALIPRVTAPSARSDIFIVTDDTCGAYAADGGCRQWFSLLCVAKRSYWCRYA